MACPAGGDGTTLPERFVPSRPDGGQTPIQPGEPVLLRSEQTGLYCLVVAAGSRSQVQCDQPSPASATPLTYTGTGVSYNGRPFINPGSGAAVYFGNLGEAPAAAQFRPALSSGPALVSGGVFNLDAGGVCRVDNTTSYVYCADAGSTSGKSPNEQFAVFHSLSMPGTVIAPGTYTLIKSVLTGAYCRAVAAPGTGKTQIKCDLSDAAQATPFVYTGTGFTYQSLPLTNPGSSQPLYLGGVGTPILPTPAVLTSCSDGSALVLSNAPGMPAVLTSPAGLYKLLLSQAGKLQIYSSSGQLVQTIAVASSSCIKPLSLVLEENGDLVIKNGIGRAVWSSGSGCAGAGPCYSLALGVDGALLIRDNDEVVVWNSSTLRGSRASGTGGISSSAGASPARMTSLTSNGQASLACIVTSPSGQSVLASVNNRYVLLISPQGRLQLMNATNQQVLWAPQATSAATGTPASRLCLQPNGTLALLGSAGTTPTWSTSAGAIAQQAAARASSAFATPFLALVTSQGVFKLLNKRCQTVFSAPAAPQQGNTSRPAAYKQPPAIRMPRPSPKRSSLQNSRQSPGLRSTPPSRPASKRRPPPRIKPVPGISTQAKNTHGSVADVANRMQSFPGAQCPPGMPRTLPAGAPCGGISYCGRDAACQNRSCCAQGLLCKRSSSFTWACSD
jgi:hypothetical protein